jgi:hypothetical protein
VHCPVSACCVRTSSVAQNELELPRGGLPQKPFYLGGQVGGQDFSVHAEGERLILTRPTSGREEIELAGPASPSRAIYNKHLTWGGISRGCLASVTRNGR